MKAPGRKTGTPFISAVIITRNEERRLPRCLASLSFADEIVVLDDESTDATRRIARDHGARVARRKLDDFAAQKNHAIGMARGVWVLSIDADEVVPPALAGELLAAARADTAGSGRPRPVAYRLPRVTFYLGRWIRHGGWYPDLNGRFFKRGQAAFEGGPVHERLVARGPVGRCVHALEHYSYESIDDHLQRMHHYSTLIARDKFARGETSSPLWALGKAVTKFLITYVYRAGFLDGRAGLVIAVLAGYYNFLKYIKLWELSSTRPKP